MNNTFSSAVMLDSIKSFRNTLYIAIKFMLDKELYDIYSKDLYCNCGDFVYSKFIGFNKMTIKLKDFLCMIIKCLILMVQCLLMVKMVD